MATCDCCATCLPPYDDVTEALWSTEIEPGLTVREIIAAWNAYATRSSTLGGHARGPTWQDIDRIRRRDDAYEALRDWHVARREPPADEVSGEVEQPAAIGGYTPIDIDARITAQQQRATAPAVATIQRKAAVEEPAGMNSLLLAAMVALLEDED